jgi:hypothetical protein
MDVGAILAVLGMGGFTVAILAIGTRLLWLFSRTRQLPELLIGVAFLGCGLGYLLMIGARAPGLAEHAHPVQVLGRAVHSIGLVSIALTTWRIFRPGGLGPLLLVCGVVLGAGCGFVGDLVFVDRAFRIASPLFWVGLATGAFTFAWAAFESFRYCGMLRRQVRLGLADAAIARRILLWGLSAAAIFLNYPVVTWNVVTTGDPFSPDQRLVTSLLTLAAALCIWAAFFPGRAKRLARAPRSPRSA